MTKSRMTEPRNDRYAERVNRNTTAEKPSALRTETCRVSDLVYPHSRIQYPRQRPPISDYSNSLAGPSSKPSPSVANRIEDVRELDGMICIARVLACPYATVQF